MEPFDYSPETLGRQLFLHTLDEEQDISAFTRSDVSLFGLRSQATLTCGLPFVYSPRDAFSLVFLVANPSFWLTRPKKDPPYETWVQPNHWALKQPAPPSLHHLAVRWVLDNQSRSSAFRMLFNQPAEKILRVIRYLPSDFFVGILRTCGRDGLVWEKHSARLPTSVGIVGEWRRPEITADIIHETMRRHIEKNYPV